LRNASSVLALQKKPGISNSLSDLAMTYASDEDMKFSGGTSVTTNSKQRWMTWHPEFSIKAPGPKWNHHYGRTPIPPLPKRRIPGVDPATVADFFPAKS
jgi:hypothetical protein